MELNIMNRFDFTKHSRVNSCQAWHMVNKEDNNVIALLSYRTIVVSYNLKTGKVKRHWGGSSITTLQHIRKWCDAMHIKMLDAKHYHDLIVESLD